MDDDGLVELATVIRRSLRSRTSDAHLVEDITQETMLRVAVAQPNLESAALRAYAIVTARNRFNAHLRNESRARRHAHRVVDYTTLGGAEELTLEREETDALAQALDILDETDRRLLLDHEVDQIDLATLATRDGTSTGAMAMRLARARAQLRLEFLLAFRRVTLPTERCRPVLLAMSAGDQRRQRDLDASAHLATCHVCAELADPLLQRRRSAAARWLPPIPALFGRAGRKLRTSHSAQAITATAVVIAAASGFLVLHHPPPSRADPPPPANIAVSATTVAASTSTTIAANSTTTPTSATTVAATQGDPTCPPVDTTGAVAPTAGCAYTFTDLTVTDVPADEGFWVTFIDNQPIWVHLTTGTESPQHVRTGDHVTLQAIITQPNDDTDPGIPPEQVDRLTARSFYLVVPDTGLQVAAHP